jgi:hypothetical protein
MSSSAVAARAVLQGEGAGAMQEEEVMVTRHIH